MKKVHGEMLKQTTDKLKEILELNGALVGAVILKQPNGAMGVFISGISSEVRKQKEFLNQSIAKMQEVIAGIDSEQIDTSPGGPGLFIGNGKGDFKAGKLPWAEEDKDKPDESAFSGI